MSDLGYVIWFIATALMIIAVLTIGTLAAAGTYDRQESPADRAETGTSTGETAGAADDAAQHQRDHQRAA